MITFIKVVATLAASVATAYAANKVRTAETAEEKTSAKKRLVAFTLVLVGTVAACVGPAGLASLSINMQGLMCYALGSIVNAIMTLFNASNIVAAVAGDMAEYGTFMFLLRGNPKMMAFVGIVSAVIISGRFLAQHFLDKLNAFAEELDAELA